MEPITGDVNVTLGAVTAAPPAPPHSYLGVADNLLAGITYAVAGLPDTATLMALGCVQAVENILKAY
ncbi:hypothetical protein [Noviherbaspirillum malthae]|uniref:hypothetical protein n=1 Tax=Noviherbaspirillum malthae TaxID=1260987 RepID=UPI001890004A|nr:hypothetical protein [Noviherbaspirillum malthae]